MSLKRTCIVATGQGKDLLPAAEEINLKLGLLLAGKEVTDDPADIRDQGSGTGIKENLPPDIDLPIEYDLPISSKEDVLSYEEFVHEASEHIENIENKILELENSPEETEIDKTIVDELNDPLIHLLRNSVDHGIETPEDRVKAGKSETGVVNLNAYHQGGNVVIEIVDDGKGLSRDKIYKKALEKKLINKNGNDYTDEEIFNFILLPGFSTVDVASDISGRGVGMDVVSVFITNLGGKLEIHSKERGRECIYY